MPAIHFPPLLANLESFIAGAFMVIAFVGWIANLVSQNQPQGKQQRRAAPPRPREGRGSAQEEIDKFLNQSRQRARQEQESGQRTAERSETISSEGVEVIERPRQAPPRRRPPQEQARRSKREVWEEQVGKSTQSAQTSGRGSSQQPNRPKPSRTGAATPPTPKPATPPSPPPRTKLSDRHIVPSIAAAEQMIRAASGNRIEKSVARDMASHLVSNVASDLGVFDTASSTSPGGRLMASPMNAASSRAEKIGNMVRFRQGIPEAILMSEIFSKPIALRRK